MKLDDQTWKLIEVAGTWLSGIGTLLAVIVALYLARIEKAVRLKVSAGVRLVFTQGQDETPEVIAISVVNLGDRPVVITNVLWKWGLFKRGYAVQVTGSPMDSLKIHQTLEVGHQGSFYIAIDAGDQENWFRRFAENLPKRFRKIWLRRLYVGIATAVGTTIWSPVENTMREKLLETAIESERGRNS